MSASRERKKRMTLEEVPVHETPAKKKKLSEGWILAICIVLVLAVVFGSIMIYNSYWRNKPVLQVGDKEITSAEFGLYYNTQVSALGQYASYLGIDTKTSLKEQTISPDALTMMPMLGFDTKDVEADTTWAQFFAESAMKMAASQYGVYNEAMAAGYTLDEEAQKQLENAEAEIQAAAESYKVSVKDFLAANYGKSCTMDTYLNFVEVGLYYQEYADAVRAGYTQEELDARYEEAPQEFDAAAFYLYTVNAKQMLPPATDDTQGEQEVTAAEIEKAKAAAEKMAETFDTEDAGARLVADMTRETVENVTEKAVADWIFDSAKEGEVRLFQAAQEGKENTWYVVKFISAADYETADLLSIFVAETKPEGAEGEDVKPVEGPKAQIVRDALAEDGSEESFRKLLVNSDYPNTVYEDAPRAQFTSYEEIYSWVYDEARKPGDWKEFAVPGGVYFYFYTGLGESFVNFSVRNEMVSTWLEEVITEAQENCNYNEEAAMHGNVGLFG